MANTILIVGNFNWYFYEEALSEGFNHLGIKTLHYKIQSNSLGYKLTHFPKLIAINNSFADYVNSNEIDAILFYRTNEIFPKTVKSLKKLKPSLKLLFYHNDNPYISLRNRIKNFLFLGCLKHSTITYVYRPSNIKDARRYGANEIRIFYPHYCTKTHLVDRVNFNEKDTDVVFVGHSENDRVLFIDGLIRNGINVKIYGPNWAESGKSNDWPPSILSGPVYGDDYKKVISRSKVALCFLSKKNNDVYTRRNFEIPSMGTLVFSEHSNELARLFKEDEVIVLFKNEQELIEKLKKYLNNDEMLKEKTLKSFINVIEKGHSEIDRAKQILMDIDGA